MPIYTAEAGRDYLWENYEANYTRDQQPLRIALLREETDSMGVTWFVYQVRWPDKVKIVRVGPRGGIDSRISLTPDELAELR